MLDIKATGSLIAGSIMAALGEESVSVILADILSKSAQIKIDPNTGKPPTASHIKSVDLIDYLLEGQIARIARQAVEQMVDSKRDEIAAAVDVIVLSDDFSNLVTASLTKKLDDKKIRFNACILEDD